MKKTVPDFSGKVVEVSIKGDSYAFAIDRPRFELQCGRLFLVGIVPHGTSLGDWSLGAGCAVAWDSVTDYLVLILSSITKKGSQKPLSTKANTRTNAAPEPTSLPIR
ncbi:MAG TPA: hypothetical protein VMH87_09365 [Pseudomonadales bacterium]|nr:hypothetical protein [Pseudomonadales bacterium]